MGVVDKCHNPIIEERIQQWSNGTTENKGTLKTAQMCLFSLRTNFGSHCYQQKRSKTQVG
ncbi:hypothetical protein MKW92_018151, partial [Papaver armeniacum]